jgi:hypothetical protein
VPPIPRRLERLNPSINPTRPSPNRKIGLERSTAFTRAISIRGGGGDLIPSVVGVDGGRGVCSALAGPSFASFASGQTNSDFGGTVPTFLYQHLRPSISRQDHQPDSDFGVLKHSIACADEAARQQPASRVVTSAFIGFENLPANPGLIAIVFKHVIAATPTQNNLARGPETAVPSDRQVTYTYQIETRPDDIRRRREISAPA